MSRPIELLLNGSVDPGVWQIDRVEDADLARIDDAGWHTMVLPQPVDKEAFIDAAYLAAQAPPGSGRNWDALSDRWRDLSWFPAGPIIVIMPWPDDPGPVARTALDVAADAAQTWNERMVNGPPRAMAVLLVTGPGGSQRVDIASLDDAAHAMGMSD